MVYILILCNLYHCFLIFALALLCRYNVAIKCATITPGIITKAYHIIFIFTFTWTCVNTYTFHE
jgi:isocitrate dehydrogenase